MGHIYAIRAAFILQLRQMLGASNFITIFDYVPVAAVLAWIATRSDNPAVLAYLSVGLSLMVIWNMSSVRMGSSLFQEVIQGTIEVNFISRTPMALVMLGKALASAAFSMLFGFVAAASLLAFSRSWVEIASVPLLVSSFGVAMFTLIACGFILAPLRILARGREGAINAFLP